MAVVQELKTWPVPFRAVADGFKRYEIRRDDRAFAVGDVLRLREWDPSTGTYLGGDIMAVVTYLTRGPEWGVPEGMVVMSLGNVQLTGELIR